MENFHSLQGFLNAIVFSQGIEGELIRSIWDTSIQTPRCGPTTKRAMQYKLSNEETKCSFDEKNVSDSDENEAKDWLEYDNKN